MPELEFTIDQATAIQLQATYQISTMASQAQGITLRIVNQNRLHEAAAVVDPTLEDAYLLATGQNAGSHRQTGAQT